MNEISDVSETTIDALASDLRREARQSDETAIRAYNFFSSDEFGTAVYFTASCRMSVSVGGSTIWGDCHADPDNMETVALSIDSAVNDEDWAN